jgi:hypothetical protein
MCIHRLEQLRNFLFKMNRVTEDRKDHYGRWFKLVTLFTVVTPIRYDHTVQYTFLIRYSAKLHYSSKIGTSDKCSIEWNVLHRVLFWECYAFSKILREMKYWNQTNQNFAWAESHRIDYPPPSKHVHKLSYAEFIPKGGLGWRLKTSRSPSGILPRGRERDKDQNYPVNFRDKRQLNSFQSLFLLRMRSTEDLNQRLFQFAFGKRPPRGFVRDKFIRSEGWYTFRSFSTPFFERGAC